MIDWHVAVLIPARNEEALLPRCLQSVIAAKRRLPHRVSCDVVVVSDASVDGTAKTAKAELREHGIVLSVQACNVGAARAAAAQAALSRCATKSSRCWLANTDADCEVPESWLYDQLLLAQLDVAAVAGVIDVDCFADHMPQVERRFRLTYKTQADGTHLHVHGANLGVRADAYMVAGGWTNLETAEDHDLWHRLGECDLRRVSTASLIVKTSGRRQGRAPSGFAQALAAHNFADTERAG